MSEQKSGAKRPSRPVGSHPRPADRVRRAAEALLVVGFLVFVVGVAMTGAALTGADFPFVAVGITTAGAMLAAGGWCLLVPNHRWVPGALLALALVVVLALKSVDSARRERTRDAVESAAGAAIAAVFGVVVARRSRAAARRREAGRG